MADTIKLVRRVEDLYGDSSVSCLISVQDRGSKDRKFLATIRELNASGASPGEALSSLIVILEARLSTEIKDLRGKLSSCEVRLAGKAA